MAKASAHFVTGRTSSIFDIDQVRQLKSHQEGNSTTSFSYEPSQLDEKIMVSSKRGAIYEPTYRLEPQDKIKSHTVKSIINSVLQNRLAGTSLWM